MAALLAVGCHSQGASSRPNVLLLTIDTLRADRLGCYGSTIPTPNIDRLAREGTLFENSACPMPATRPSHFSILTSRYPRDHGVVNNALALPSDITTLSGVFKEAGYRTAAFVGVTLLNAESGAARGFDSFDLPQGRRQRDAEVIVPRVVEWLSSTGATAPFFLWVHLFDPHMPYEPPPPYAPNGPDPFAESLPTITWESLMSLAERNGGDLPAGAYERAVRLYDGEVAKTDSWVGVLLDALRTRGILDRTIVAFTADHGECFEHGIFFDHYGCLFDGAAHVPLIFRYPAKVASGVRRPTVTEHVDIAPTILRLAGLPAPAGFSGMALFQADGTSDRYAVIQRPISPMWIIQRRTKRDRRLRSVKGERSRVLPPNEDQFGLRGGQWKFLVTGAREELYDLTRDPGELRDLATLRPEVVARLRPILQEWLVRHPLRKETEVAVPSEELKETLRALGYVQ